MSCIWYALFLSFIIIISLRFGSWMRVHIHITNSINDDVFKNIRDIIQSVSTFCQSGQTYIIIRDGPDTRPFLHPVCGRMSFSVTDWPNIRSIVQLRPDIRYPAFLKAGPFLAIKMQGVKNTIFQLRFFKWNCLHRLNW